MNAYIVTNITFKRDYFGGQVRDPGVPAKRARIDCMKHRDSASQIEKGINAPTLFLQFRHALEGCIEGEAKKVVGRRGCKKWKAVVELLRYDDNRALKLARYAKGKCEAVPEQVELIGKLLQDAGREEMLEPIVQIRNPIRTLPPLYSTFYTRARIE